MVFTSGRGTIMYVVHGYRAITILVLVNAQLWYVVDARVALGVPIIWLLRHFANSPLATRLKHIFHRAGCGFCHVCWARCGVFSFCAVITAICATPVTRMCENLSRVLRFLITV